MTADPDAMQGTLTLEGARVAVLGYDADAREHALALRRAGNAVTIGLVPETTAWWQARADGFAVEPAKAAVAGAEVVVVREPDVLWRQCESCVAPGALVVFASARALHSGACARGGMDVVLVTTIDDDRVGARIGVHRDVTRRALVRAVAYARAAFGATTLLRATSVADEAELELAARHERVAKLLALTVSSAPLPPRTTPSPTWDFDDEPEPADAEDSAWFYSLLNRRGTR